MRHSRTAPCPRHAPDPGSYPVQGAGERYRRKHEQDETKGCGDVAALLRLLRQGRELRAQLGVVDHAIGQL
jgi:hypothetical protein